MQDQGGSSINYIITARKRSLRRLCFYRCLSVHSGEGACVVAGGACVVARGHAWLWGVVHGCWGHAWLPGGMHGCGGVCVVGRGHVWLWGACMVAGGHAWLLGACMVMGGHAWLLGGVCGGWGGVHRIQRDTVNEWAVRILLECILVY